MLSLLGVPTPSRRPLLQTQLMSKYAVQEDPPPPNLLTDSRGPLSSRGELLGSQLFPKRFLSILRITAQFKEAVEPSLRSKLSLLIRQAPELPPSLLVIL